MAVTVRGLINLVPHTNEKILLKQLLCPNNDTIAYALWVIVAACCLSDSTTTKGIGYTKLFSRHVH